MTIFAGLPPKECSKEKHLLVKGENVTNTLRYLGNDARYDATNSLALSQTRSHSLVTVDMMRVFAYSIRLRHSRLYIVQTAKVKSVNIQLYN